MLHYGQGKWYPGEPLPRWQYGLYWRKDGIAIWQNKALMAEETHPVKYIFKDAEVFAEELAKHLAVNPDDVTPAYEDAFYFCGQRGKRPLISIR